MRHIIFSSVACMAVPYFSTLSHKRHDLWKTFMNMKCVFWFSLQLSSEMFLILRRIKRGIFINVHRSSCYAPVILVRLLMELKFSLQIFLYCSNINFHESSSSGSRDFPCGERGWGTDMAKETVAFHSFANMPYNL